MKAFYLPLLMIAFSACRNNTQQAIVPEQQRDTVKTDIDIDSLIAAEEQKKFKNGQVFVSEDGRVTIESDICPLSGTAPDYWVKWTIINDKGEKHELRYDNTYCNSTVHALHKRDGSTYYIVNCSAKASSTDGYEWLEAYRIVGDSIQEVNVKDGGKKIDNSDFHANYCIPDLYFATNGAGYDWIFEYDAKDKSLYVPVVHGHEFIDRYRVWRFNGNHFVYMGEQPHKNLHKSLGKYNRLISYFTTKDYIVRVDSLDSHELRYASWMKPKTISDEPDIILKGGKRREYHVGPDEYGKCDDYYFTNGGYEYIVNYCETTHKDDGYGEHHDYLLVKGGDMVIVKQEKEQKLF